MGKGLSQKTHRKNCIKGLDVTPASPPTFTFRIGTSIGRGIRLKRRMDASKYIRSSAVSIRETDSYRRPEYIELRESSVPRCSYKVREREHTPALPTGRLLCFVSFISLLFLLYLFYFFARSALVFPVSTID